MLNIQYQPKAMRYRNDQSKLERIPKENVAYTVSSVVATIAHTLMVLGGIYVFFGEAYAEAIGVGHELLMGLIGTTIATNGILEAVLAGVITCAIAKAVSSYGMKAKKAN